MRIQPLIEAKGPALPTLTDRVNAGWKKPSKDEIAAARAEALKSPIYQKILKLKNVVDNSTPTQIRNGTINFLINGHIYFQCTSSLAIRYQGPNDHNSRGMDLPADIIDKPLPEAYIVMLDTLYDKFKDYGREGGLNITEAPGYKPSKVRASKSWSGQSDNFDLSLKYRGITSLKGFEGAYGSIDLDGNLLEDLDCDGKASCRYLILDHNPLKSFKGMPECEYLKINGATGIDWHEEAKHLTCSEIAGVSPDSDGFGALLFLPQLKMVNMSSHPKLSREQSSHIQVVIGEAMRGPKADRRKILLTLQQWAIDNDIDDYVHP